MEIEIVQETCCSIGCGINFWISKDYRNRLISTKRDFYCPNGHSMAYQGETDKQKAERLLRERDNLQFRKDNLERINNAEIARLKRALKRKCPTPRKKKG